MDIVPHRPKGWLGRHWPRVCFIGHALSSGDLSTDLIEEQLGAVGRAWPEQPEDPGCIRWLSFPFIPPSRLGQAVWVDVCVIPLLATDFFRATGGDNRAGQWVMQVAETAMREAAADDAHLTIAWGALTKQAVEHGRLFHERHRSLSPGVRTTHGDAGTAMLVLEKLRASRTQSSSTIAVIGANGAIGDVVSRAIARCPLLEAKKLVLVGRPDKPGQREKRERLEELRGRVEMSRTRGPAVSVAIHQNKDTVFAEHAVDVVIVTLGGAASLNPRTVPASALVFDLTTPSACTPAAGWESTRVITAGCGVVPASYLPDGMGRIGGRTLTDIGAGGAYHWWGCLCDAVIGASLGRQGHEVELPIPTRSLIQCFGQFSRFGVNST